MNRDYKRISVILVIAALLLCACGCVGNGSGVQATPEPTSDGGLLVPTNTDTTTAQLANVFDFTFSQRDTREKYDEARAIVELSDGASTVNGDGVEIEGDIVTFTADGVYYVSGALSNGKLVVNTSKEEKVQLVLNGVDVHCNDGAAIEVWQADKVFITLASNTSNTVSDGAEYAATDIGSNACIFSKEDLTINGSGSLTVTGNYKHGVSSRDDLVVALCTLNVTAVADGIRGKDCVKITEAVINIEAQDDAIISDNMDDSWRGYVYIESGSINLTAGTDGIQAETVALIEGGELNIFTGGGGASATTTSDNVMNDSWGHGGPGQGGMQLPQGNQQENQTNSSSAASMKGIKAAIAINIEGGNIAIDSEDDALHSDGDININSGSIAIKSGDDGVHAADALVINGGTVNIENSYEGLEAKNITINGGNIYILSSDDGMNAAGGTDGAVSDGRPAQDSFTADSDAFIKICGGYIYMNCSGDGLDSNGDFFMNAGVLLISGPTADNNSAIDYQGEGVVNGGVVVAIGSSGMAQSFDDKHSGQAFISCRFNGNAEAGTVVTIKDNDGKAILSFTGEKAFRSIVISCPELVSGESYNFYVGGAVTGADEFGFAYGEGIAHEGGESVGSITA